MSLLEDDWPEELLNVWVLIWFCPARKAHGYAPGAQYVEWTGGVGRCLAGGCGRTNQDSDQGFYRFDGTDRGMIVS